MKSPLSSKIILGVLSLAITGLSAQAAALTVVNFSFEDDVAGPGGVSRFTPSGWISFGAAAVPDIGSQNPTSSQFSLNNPLAAPAEGDQFAYVNMFGGNPAGGGIFQDVGALLPNTQYTLTVAIGSRLDRLNSPGVISLVNGFDNSGTVLAQGGGLPATQDTWQDYSISFTTGDVVTENLIIVLSCLGAETIQADFDNVRLEAIAVPEPSVVALCLLGGLAMTVARRRRGV